MTDRPPKLIVESSSGRSEIALTTGDMKLQVSELLRRKAMPLNTRCGQRGLCEGCIVELAEGQLIEIDSGKAVSASDLDEPVRSCMYAPGSGVPGSGGNVITLRVPDRSLMAYKPQVLDAFRINTPRAHDPLWRVGNGENAPTTGSPLGVAIDIGTTTIALLVVDLASGEILSRAAAFNKQMHLGDDVLTRINLCFNDSTLVGRLQEAVVNETIGGLIDKALEQAGATRDRVVCVTAAGNTTMLHLLAGVDPSPMGLAPFTPAFVEHRRMRLSEIKFHWPAPGAPGAPGAAQTSLAETHNNGHDPQLHLLPSAAAYVGADLTAGIVATGLHYNQQTSMLVDVGTNGEIILKHDDKLYGCATAAGPAFEGAGLRDGIRAGDGAISYIRLTKEPFAVDVEVIGGEGAKPIGLCGSAYIDFLAEGVRTGLLDPMGRLHPERLPGAEKLVFEEDKDYKSLAFRVARGSGNRPISVAESDVATLLQAKGAIAAGILTLLERVGLTVADVKTLYLAGGFGMHLRIENAIGCGLLPGFDPKQIEVVGNTSLAGAYLSQLDRTVVDEMATVAAEMDIIELNLDPGFELRYIEQLMLPEPDAEVV